MCVCVCVCMWCEGDEKGEIKNYGTRNIHSDGIKTRGGKTGMALCIKMLSNLNEVLFGPLCLLITQALQYSEYDTGISENVLWKSG